MWYNNAWMIYMDEKSHCHSNTKKKNNHFQHNDLHIPNKLYWRSPFLSKSLLQLIRTLKLCIPACYSGWKLNVDWNIVWLCLEKLLLFTSITSRFVLPIFWCILMFLGTNLYNSSLLLIAFFLARNLYVCVWKWQGSLCCQVIVSGGNSVLLHVDRYAALIW